MTDRTELVKRLRSKQFSTQYRAIDDAADALEKMDSECAWTYDDTHCKWDTACDHAFYFMETYELPTESGFRFCAFCGGKLKAFGPGPTE